MRYVFVALWGAGLWAAVTGSVRGVVHDPDHRPVPNATVLLKAVNADFSKKLTTDSEGRFESAVVPAGAYNVTVSREGFETARQEVVVLATGSPVMHILLSLPAVSASVNVEESALAVNPETVTPTTLVSRQEIAETPGASLSNSLNMITNFVPGAWVTHDQLHVRGGHQVTWALDGVPVPNTNIASNVGPQVDPKDIDYLEMERGGYSADYGDRAYGVLDVIPRTGFERNSEGEFSSTLGSFLQTNDDINFGNHSEKFAYYASFNVNRSDYGLETPGPEISHDAVWGAGGMTTLIYNPDASNQLRVVSSLRRDDYEIPDSRDNEHERDAVAELTWIHTFSSAVSLAASPFYHFNRANYDGDPQDEVATTQHRDSSYAGGQISVTALTARNDLRAGAFAFGQRDDEFVQVLDNSYSPMPVTAEQRSSGQLEALFLQDQYKLTSWLALSAGARLTHFGGSISENAADPRLGGSIRLPGIGWVLRAFWGMYYQAPPLSTISGPLAQYAAAEGIGFIPLRGERDQEHQFGLTIPFRGWSFDVNDYHQRAHNYFDHDAIGNSNVFFPLTIDHARLYGWEFQLRSPRLMHRGDIHIAYAYAHAEGAGAVSGGLTDFSPPDAGYFLLDHDQRHTLHAGFAFDLPLRVAASGDYYLGSGFTDGSGDNSVAGDAHLQPHSTFDLALARDFGERLRVSITALNVTNRRFLLDNSETFGGTHYAEPRQIYGGVLYRFHF